MPLLVKSEKDGIDDSLHAGNVGEQDHGPGAAADLDEAALDGVGGAQLAPQLLREVEKGEQLGQVALQSLDQGRVLGVPVERKRAKAVRACAALRAR